MARFALQRFARPAPSTSAVAGRRLSKQSTIKKVAADWQLIYCDATRVTVAALARLFKGLGQPGNPFPDLRNIRSRIR